MKYWLFIRNLGPISLTWAAPRISNKAPREEELNDVAWGLIPDLFVGTPTNTKDWVIDCDLLDQCELRSDICRDWRLDWVCSYFRIFILQNFPLMSMCYFMV